MNYRIVRTIFLTFIYFAISILVTLLVSSLTVLVKAKHAESGSVSTQAQPIATESASPITPLPNVGNPVKLTIPKIGVSADIQYVGRTTDGKRMAVPKNYKDVGWYRLGAKPGKSGNAVMAGHLDNSLGLNAVFANLQKLQEGDLVEVTDDQGHTHTFAVTGKSVYSVTTGTTAQIFGNATTANLNLITCDGTWIKDQKMYDQRLVVFTTLVDSTALTE
jgi:LPXTG-site transpeptidase (sortase) family protein